ncbi:hypothetical protein [Streptomyces sp. UNOB3_S3]|uniref:hypothetical protein n=1 Tax=Streptomyces sp. UNOB3_S3 TaxID=2871682 RepID=UPI001E5AFD45|nr:hypothetical protein [Streptomyces sp. UNOB3_S3]MCC3775088.1 hypothetical protein [Streptomyces sp. UNOB3_S3]
MRAGQQTGQVPRALRAGVFAAVCVLLAALGHAVMSGTTVPWWAIAVALTTTGGCAWFLAGRERGPLLITLATVGAQTGLHSFFAVAQSVATRAADTAAGGGGSATASDLVCGGFTASESASMPMDHGGMSSMGHGMGGMGGMDGMGMSMHAGHGALGMWSAHVLVALICGIWLSGGEQAAFRLGRTIATRLRGPLVLLFHDVPARPRPPRVRAGFGRAAQRLRQLLYAHVLATRGPPGHVVAVA